MSTKKLSTIKAVTGFRKMKPDAVYSAANAIYAGLNGNANISAPPAPFDLPTLLAANQELSAANSAALDGGTKALAQRNRQKEVVVKLLDQLAKYVQSNCKDDMTIFLSSGFKAQSSTKTTATTASESIRSVKVGPNTGQAQVKLVAVQGAGSYEVRWAPVPAGGVPSAWTTQPITNVRSATLVTGLTPGTTYAFQARAVIQSAYTDWSDSVMQMAT
jgi:Fibronectin type III domain